MNELDTLLDGIETSIPEGVLAEMALENGTIPEEGSHEEATGYTIDRDALYADQESKVGIGSEEESAPVTAKQRKAKKRNKAGVVAKADDTDGGTEVIEDGTETVIEAKEPKVKLPPASCKSEALGRKVDINGLEAVGFDATDVQAILTKMDAMPKKVSEKAFNLLAFVLGKENLSNFTRITFQTLRDAGDEGLTVPNLVKLLEAGGSTHVPYQPGTARSQSQQVASLFRTYGLVNAERTMHLDRTNEFAKVLLARVA